MRTALVILCASLAACSVSREGWGRGRFIVVVESIPLQVRRSTIRVEDTNGELVMNWIGARAPVGEPLLSGFSVTLFDDANGDNVPQSNEVLSYRSNVERSEKILFSDIRAPADSAKGSWKFLVAAQTLGGGSFSSVVAFREDR
ncbi:MAG: hypothetical protein JNL28_06455 [Planctomycetes bacterium]|nr:hypothetical protein [Planctomycetota bacterium]